MAYEVAWAESAIVSLIDAIEYIARDSPSYAAAFAVRAERAAASLDIFPDRGRRVPELNDPAVRELSITSHRLIYRVGRNQGCRPRVRPQIARSLGSSGSFDAVVAEPRGIAETGGTIDSRHQINR
jgi:plasmid stabilization system protein ParE